ncbi:hypothetical protein BJ170DRAFT_589867 [Xylariales sp. AK1849]|nr:hypothetical protein BJ170DRAFT_589867 [Xylariales sp. AK1849]
MPTRTQSRTGTASTALRSIARVLAPECVERAKICSIFAGSAKAGPRSGDVVGSRDRLYRFTRDAASNTMCHSPMSARYDCCRVLSYHQFFDIQKDMASQKPSWHWKRRCRSCIWRIYGNAPASDLAFVEWKGRTLCRHCKLLKGEGRGMLGLLGQEEE